MLEDPEEDRGADWEAEDYVEMCRECESKFELTLWKHHCRACGGVFCENCLQTIQVKNALNGGKSNRAQPGNSIKRICNGCKRGEAGGSVIKMVFKYLVALNYVLLHLI